MNNNIYTNQHLPKLVLDEKDRSILGVLVGNARASIAEIVHKTGVLRDTVAYRLKRMEESKLIFHYNTLLDPSILGYSYFAIALIKLEPLPERELKDFQEKLIKMPNLTHINKTLGSVDLVVYIVAKDATEFGKIIDQIKNTSELNAGKKIINNIDTLNIIHELKVDNFSGLI